MLRFAFRTCTAALLALAGLPALAINHTQSAPPVGQGRFPVACSNVEHDLARMAAIGGVPTDYWEGNAINGTAHYITEILVHPESTLTFSVTPPFKPFMYPTLLFRRIDFAAIVCYPTSRTNGDADYALPGQGGTVPHMALAGQAPKLITAGEFAQVAGLVTPANPNAAAALPLVVYSHGLAGSPLGKGYIDVMTALASNGFMVSAIFHADARYSKVHIDDLADLAFTLLFFPSVVEMQALRPLGLKAMTDALLVDTRYAPGIDTTRIGAFGASLGGEAVLHLMGARITASLSKSCDDPVHDPRIRAAVGYVPYSGQTFLPAFCDGQSGAASVNRPFLGISGTADTTAPIGVTQQAVNLMQSSRYLIAFNGGKHELRLEDAGDVLAWTVTFLSAYLDLPYDTGMARLTKMASVTGGADDHLLIDVHVPATAGTGPRAVEYRDNQRERYTFAVGEAENAAYAARGDLEFARHAMRTGSTVATAAAPIPVCRYTRNGWDTFGVGDLECEALARGRGWIARDTPFFMPALQNGDCPAGQLQVMRAWGPTNQGRLPDRPEVRLTTSDSTQADMARAGWKTEGPVMCAPA